MLKIFDAKRGDPNKFQSFWEMDEEDIDEESMEEIQKNPAKKILWAAENNKQEMVKELLNSDSGLVGSRDADGYTPLHRAAYNGHTDMVILLLENEADINAKTGDGWCPIHSASRWNQADVLSILLQFGANINAQTNSGQTALHIASSDRECRQCLEMLLWDKNTDTSLRNSLNETAYDICQRTSENCLLFETKEDSVKKLKQDS
ncbi:ankyrin repeat domain-containing protein 49-like isoform X2 [Mercenaria mercenaria]|uniref:ankyrin repeat domain-containing protein 49-like isoform X2 n=1 Tax=Mercenaria mercenaria TaxID=6596 RepID=UPI001E1D2A10|nr:ankyrin repeat domain-containing protein 49-like isoform X2 [Mercenaria mercenaria]